MLEDKCEVINRKGLHARACAQITKMAQLFQSNITLRHDEKSADASSMIKLLALDAPMGSILTVRTEGADEAEAMLAINQLFADKFGEDQGL